VDSVTQQLKGAAFRALHDNQGTFVIPNPWDAGSAMVLAGLGFKALATTSSGFAFTLGKPDGALAVGRDEVLANAKAIVDATNLPVSADLENLYAHEPEEAAKTIALAAETGLVGCSIEDWSGDPQIRIYDFELAVDRVRAAVEAVRALGFPFTLTARAENLIRGVPDLDDTIRRLQAYEEAGADVLYAPGLNDLQTVRTVTAAVDRPVNALATASNAHLTLADYAEAGVKRISVGGNLARVATGAFLQAAKEIAEVGTFAKSANPAPAQEVADLLRKGGA
jgi:2-methylisocitrate lyase-like PEP mutase family enzyme